MMKLHHIHTRSWLGLAKTIHTYVYTVYIRHFWQGNYHTYGHIRCTYAVLANPSCVVSRVAYLWVAIVCGRDGLGVEAWVDLMGGSSILLILLYATVINRVGQNHTYTVYIRYFWLGDHQMYGHIRCLYTVLANPSH